MSGTLLTPRQVSDRLAVSVGTLANWRYLGVHLKFRKIGGAVRYDANEIERYLKHTVRKGTGL